MRSISRSGAASVAVVLDPRGAQPRQTIAVDRALPGQELVHGQRVTLARFLQAQQTATDCGHYLRLAPYDPALSILGREVGHGQRTSVGPDDVAHARPVLLFGHDTHNSFLTWSRG